MENKHINGYVLKYKLGDGGMAEVWYAENYLQKPAAVKVLLKKFCDEPEVVSRFQNEARLMVQMNHPGIRNIQDLGSIDGQPCMIMEYLEGMDLAKRMKHGEHFSNDQLIGWWNDVVEALQYTHRKGIIHRDIKPANLFITENGRIKLLDFGVAKIKDNITVTQTGSRMGTLMYMSPEQVYDVKNLTGKTDAYSLAVTFFHLISGRPPYDSSRISDFEIQESIVRKEIDVTGLAEPWRSLLPGYFHKDATRRRELQKIGGDQGVPHGDTILIHPTPQAPLPQPVAKPRPVHQPLTRRPGRAAFYFLFPVAVILGLIAFALNRDRIAGFLKKDEPVTVKKEPTRRKPQPKKSPKPQSADTPAPQLADTINSIGEDGMSDQVIVSVDLHQKEADMKSLINRYYRSRGDCANLSTFFKEQVKQYYNKTDVPISSIEKECETYHGKWRYTEAIIGNDSYVFTHHQDGSTYIDFNMLYQIKQNEADAWIAYNIDVSMVVDPQQKIERIVERRIEKL